MADVKEITRNALQTAGKASPAKGDYILSKPAGLAAAGVAVAALPVVVERITKLVGPKVADLGDQAKQAAKEQVKEKAQEVTPDIGGKLFRGGGLGSMFGGGGDDGEDGAGEGSAAPGHGSGRRMPIQQSVDVAVPIKTAYNQWTRFEDWPDFMHRFESVDQIDDATIAFQTKVWGIKKRFEAEILEQRPDERIEWDVSEGLAHTGVVTFHRLSNRLTRIEVTLDIEPDSLVEKAGRGWRFAKRAVRGDLHRFKAHVELNDSSDRGWRGTIKDGDVKRRTERKGSNRSHGSRNGARASGKSRSNSRSRSRTGGGSS